MTIVELRMARYLQSPNRIDIDKLIAHFARSNTPIAEQMEFVERVLSSPTVSPSPSIPT